jgi:hypothetical protein
VCVWPKEVWPKNNDCTLNCFLYFFFVISAVFKFIFFGVAAIFFKKGIVRLHLTTSEINRSSVFRFKIKRFLLVTSSLFWINADASVMTT